MECEKPRPRGKQKRARNRVRAEDTTPHTSIDRADESVVDSAVEPEVPTVEEKELTPSSDVDKSDVASCSASSLNHEDSVHFEDSVIVPAAELEGETVVEKGEIQEIAVEVAEGRETLMTASTSDEEVVEEAHSRTSTMKSRTYPTLLREKLSSVNQSETIDINDKEEEEIQQQILVDIRESTAAAVTAVRPIDVADSAIATTSSSAPPLSALCVEPPLLSEAQLKNFYTNHELEIIDDFTDAFVANELNANDAEPFAHIVGVFCQLCKSVDVKDAHVAEVKRRCDAAGGRLWQVEQRQVKATGKCGDKKPASGSATYDTFVVHQEVVDELSEHLRRHREAALDQSACTTVHRDAVEIQCKWYIERVIREYFRENGLRMPGDDAPLPVLLLSTAPPHVYTQSSRLQMRACLSILFHNLRQSNLAASFVAILKTWIERLTTALLACGTYIEHQSILNHILRCPIRLDGWAVALVQPTIYPTPPYCDVRACVDHAMAMLYTLLTPIRKREEFLHRCARDDVGDNSWTIVDDDGAEEQSRLVCVDEGDMIALLQQFSFDTLYAHALNMWTNQSDEINESALLSLFAFQLTMMKLLYDALKTYARPQYRQLGKQLVHMLKSSICYVGEVWQSCRSHITPHYYAQMQAEYDRILLLAIQAILNSHAEGTWHSLADLPYSSASSNCLQRIHVMLRSEETLPFHELTTLSASKAKLINDDVDKLVARVTKLDINDSTHIMDALGAVAAVDDHQSMMQIVHQIFYVCFVNESTRATLYKCGGELLAVLIDKHTSLLSDVIRLCDRSSDVGDFLPNVLNMARLHDCQLHSDDVAVLGKWLMTCASPSLPQARLARAVLNGIDWKRQAPDIVDDVQDVIVGAHRKHCAQTNGMLAVGVKKALKIASRIDDVEAQFDGFCWEILLRTQYHGTQISEVGSTTDDTTNAYLTLMRGALRSLDSIKTTGLPLLSSLLHGASYMPSIRVLYEIVTQHALEIDEVLSLNQDQSSTVTLAKCMHRVMHSDENSVTAVLSNATGVQRSPDQYVKMLASAITFDLLASSTLPESSIAWIKCICSSSPTWHEDYRSSMVLLNCVVRTVVQRDVNAMNEIGDCLKVEYSKAIARAKQAGRGMLDWISNAEPIAVPLIDAKTFGIAPWFAYFALQVEHQQFIALHTKVDDYLAKDAKIGLETALKKSCAKLQITFSIDRLNVCRWLDLAIALAQNAESHPAILPLAVQYVLVTLLRRRDCGAKNGGVQIVCPGEKYVRCKPIADRVEELTSLLQQVETVVRTRADSNMSSQSIDEKMLKVQEFDAQIAEFYMCARRWLKEAKNYSVNESNNQSSINQQHTMDYLLPLIFSGDTEPWMNFVDLSTLEENHRTLSAHFSSVCQLGDCGEKRRTSPLSTSGYGKTLSLHRLRSRLAHSAAHPTSPVDDAVRLPRFENMARDAIMVMGGRIDDYSKGSTDNALLIEHLTRVLRAAHEFVALKFQIAAHDAAYITMVPQMYAEYETTVNILLKCHSSILQPVCQQPRGVSRKVTRMTKAAATVDAMDENRTMRKSSVCTLIPDHMSTTKCDLAVVMTLVGYQMASAQSAQDSGGMQMFACLLAHIDEASLQCPLTDTVLADSVNQLATNYISNVAHRQLELLQTIISRKDVAHLLLPAFTPDILTPVEFLQIYRLSTESYIEARIDDVLALSLFTKMRQIRGVLENLSTAETKIELLPLIVKVNTFTASKDDCPLTPIACQHLHSAYFARYPNYCCDVIGLIMAEINNSLAIPPSTLSSLTQSLTTNSTFNLAPINAHQLIDVVTHSLQSCRKRHGAKTMAVWVSNVTQLTEYVVYLWSRCLVNMDAGVDITAYFTRITALYSPFLEPSGGVILPWSPDDNAVANVVCAAYVDCVKVLHAAHVEGAKDFRPISVAACFWTYYSSHFTQLKRAARHVHQILNLHFVQLPWSTFMPAMEEVRQMHGVLVEGAEDCKILTVNIIVRVPWRLTYGRFVQHNPPIDVKRQMVACLAHMFTATATDDSTWVDCRASLPAILVDLSSAHQSINQSIDWSLLNDTDVGQLLRTISKQYDPLYLPGLQSSSEQMRADTAGLRLMSTCCHFIVCPISHRDLIAPPTRHGKQLAYVKCLVELLARGMGQMSEEVLTRLLLDVDAVVNSWTEDGGDDRQSCQLTICIIELMNKIHDTQRLDVFLQCLLLTLRDRPLTYLPLLLLGSIYSNGIPRRTQWMLRLCDASIASYWRCGGTRWSTLIGWLNVEDGKGLLKSIMQDVNSNFEQNAHLLTVNALVLSLTVMAKAAGNSNQQNGLLYSELVEYLSTVRQQNLPDAEAQLLLVYGTTFELLLQILDTASCTFLENKSKIDQFLGLLSNTGEVKSGGLLGAMGIGKKIQFCTAFRLICAVLSNFIQQQIVNDGTIRMDCETPVTNAKIQTTRDLISHKSHAAFASHLQIVLPYFTQPSDFCLRHTNKLFGVMTRKLFIEQFVQSFEPIF